MGRLDGKVAIITGGTSGMGARTVEVFVAEGATVVFCGRREALGQQLAAQLGAKTEFSKVDVAVESEVAHLITRAAECHGRIDVLFNNAGIAGPGGSIADLDMDAFHRAMNVLVAGVIHGMKHVAPIMKTQGSGSIINNASIGGHRAGFSGQTYSAAKAAVIHLSRCVAMELGESGIRVNSISPGAIATEIFGKVFGVSEDRLDKAVDAIKEPFATFQPIQRTGMPDDIAHAALFLASDESSFVNGHDLIVDGGLIGGRQWSAQREGVERLKQMFDPFAQ